MLSDRDWTHPEAGGTGTTMRALVTRWVAAGHHVTMIAGSYPGAARVERPHERLEIHRMGTRLTVFPLAAFARWRGLGRDVDVVFEVVNGIAFFTPLWPVHRRPTVAFVQHVHQQHYVTELGWRGRIGALLLERLPLRYLYRRSVFCTISQSARHEMINELGVAPEAIHVVYLGVEPLISDTPKAARPTLLYFGRLKRYKRLELLLDALERSPRSILEVAGDGDYRSAFEAEIARRGLRDRVVMHGFVPEAEKGNLYARAWLNITTSSAEGWGLCVMEAASCGTPSVALRVGGLGEAIVDGHTGVLADHPSELGGLVAQIMDAPGFRDRLGRAAAERAATFMWDRSADEMLSVMRTAANLGEDWPDPATPVVDVVRHSAPADVGPAMGPAVAPAPTIPPAALATDDAVSR